MQKDFGFVLSAVLCRVSKQDGPLLRAVDRAGCIVYMGAGGLGKS